MAFQRIEKSYCIRESSLAFYFLLILALYMGVFLLYVITDFSYERFLPTYNFGNCTPPDSEDLTPLEITDGLRRQNFLGFWFESAQLLGLMLVTWGL